MRRPPPKSARPTIPSAATAAPVRGNEPPPLDAAITVTLVETCWGAPVVPEPDATIVCAPGAVEAGTVTVACTVPLASALTVPSTTGSECSVIVTLLDACHPDES